MGLAHWIIESLCLIELRSAVLSGTTIEFQSFEPTIRCVQFVFSNH